MSNLDKYLQGPVAKLVAQPEVTLVEEENERHRIYCGLLMACTRNYWNGNKNGRQGEYPLNPSTAAGDVGRFLDADYRGHNIACLAVDGDGLVIDFDFNHNSLFDSSAEHAEARLVRRLFSLTQIHDSWNVRGDAHSPKGAGNLLKEVTVYTTLESCAQCSGIMALGQVKAVVYLQQDPGVASIGNILRRLTEKTNLQSPVPISANMIGLDCFDQFSTAFQQFTEQQLSMTGEPFHRAENSHPQYTDSITSFLCTKAAYQVYRAGEQAFDASTDQTLQFPGYRPHALALTNSEALIEAKSFRQYAIDKGKRGTPHH